MEKFKKLSRAEMKKIAGGTPACGCNAYTKCQCPHGPLVCVSVHYGNGCSGSRATGAVCMDYCNGSAGVYLPTGCWTTSTCGITPPAGS